MLADPVEAVPGEPLKVLAEAEHERWIQSKFDGIWAYATVTNEAKKLHK
jgi:hypothetical protein